MTGSRADTVQCAVRHGVRRLQVDAGGAHRGPRLDRPEEIARLRAARSQTGITLTGLTLNHANDLGLTCARDTEQGRAVTRLIGLGVRLAVELDIPTVNLPSFRRSTITTATDLRRTADRLREAAEEASDHGVIVGTENVLAPRELDDLLRRVDHPALRVVADTGNLLEAGLDVGDVLGTAADRVAAEVHLKHPAGAADLKLLWSVVERDVLPTIHPDAFLLENDYVEAPARLADDLRWLRGQLSGLLALPVGELGERTRAGRVVKSDRGSAAQGRVVAVHGVHDRRRPAAVERHQPVGISRPEGVGGDGAQCHTESAQHDDVGIVGVDQAGDAPAK
jgi:hypothetical protein